MLLREEGFDNLPHSLETVRQRTQIITVRQIPQKCRPYRLSGTRCESDEFETSLGNMIFTESTVFTQYRNLDDKNKRKEFPNF